MKIITFFNNKGGVGKTSLVYHLAWMFADLGYRVVAADLDPQANLSTMFLSDERLVGLFEEDHQHAHTIYRAVEPLTGVADIRDISLELIDERLALVPGDIRLSTFEDALSKSWTECLGQDLRPFHVISAFYRVLLNAAASMRADVALVDVGPNLGAINRSALLAADHVIFPVGADLFSLYGLRNLGPTITRWRKHWLQRRIHFQEEHPTGTVSLPSGTMAPSGYITTQYSQYGGRESKAYKRWADRIPEIYLREVYGDEHAPVPSLSSDPNCLARLKHYRSLMPMAQEARKPIFHLTPADGAIGAHYYATRECEDDFRALAQRIAQRCDIQPGTD